MIKCPRDDTPVDWSTVSAIAGVVGMGSEETSGLAESEANASFLKRVFALRIAGNNSSNQSGQRKAEVGRALHHWLYSEIPFLLIIKAWSSCFIKSTLSILLRFPIPTLSANSP